MADVVFNADIKIGNSFDTDIKLGNTFGADFGQVTKVSTSNYEELFNKPILNGRTIIGDKVSNDYDLQDRMDEITPQDIDKIFYGG